MSKVTQLVRVKDPFQSRNRTLKGVNEEGSMKGFFNKLGAGLRELTVD